MTFGEYPGWYGGHQVPGIRLRFEDGVIVEASSESHEDFLLTTLDTDEGARRLGEFGIGCNEGIDRAYGNALFDEKIYGTIHLAVGAGFPPRRHERERRPLGHRQGAQERRRDLARRRARPEERRMAVLAVSQRPRGV